MNIFKNDNKKIKIENRGKENELKNNLCEENNDLLINELNDLFSKAKGNNDCQPNIKEQMDDNDKNNESNDDKEQDLRINFEQLVKLINQGLKRAMRELIKEKKIFKMLYKIK